MNNERFHPVLTEPPLAHALHHYDAEKGLLRYEYNGVTLIEVRVPAGTDLGFRHGSDGSMQSFAYLQQVYLAAEPPCSAQITVRLNRGSLNMRPRRAGADEAVLGTQPHSLCYGVNGLYDIRWDLLVDWHGNAWRWLSSGMEEEDEAFVLARFETGLSMSALYINLRMGYYARHLGYGYHRPWRRMLRRDAVAGWCSWEAYRRDVDIRKVEQVSAFIGEKLRDYGLRYLQVDDGYQAMPLPARAEMTMAEGWMTCDAEKFPGGHASIVRTVTEMGLTPAIWVNVNITNPDFPKAHPESVLWKDGEALRGEWIDYLYRCDEATLKTHIEPLFRALREAGYGYVKIDAIRHLLFDGLHECVRLGLMDNETASARFRALMEATRRGMGDEMFYLCSWGEMHELVGVADACRISMDANPTWAGVRMQLFESARWYHTHRVLFINDPDHACVRTKPEWAKSLLSLISLSGELYMLSDTPADLTEEKLDIIRKTLPPLATTAGETGALPMEYPAYTWTKLHGFAVQSHETPVEMEDIAPEEADAIAGETEDRDSAHPFGSLWSFAMTRRLKRWRVMLRVAVRPLRESSLGLERIALEPDKTYVAFDFWEQRYLGEVTGAFACRALPLGHCQVVAFYEKPDTPTVIASSRHVSMDAVSVIGEAYENGALRLCLRGVAGTVADYHIYVPRRDGGGEVRSITVAFERGEVELCLPMGE